MDNLQALIKEHGVRLVYRKGMNVFTIGGDVKTIYYLESGWIKITQEAEEGQTITLSLRKPGELFGLAEVLAQTKLRARCAYSLTDTTVYALPVERLQQFLNERPIFWKMLSKLMAERLIETQHYVRALTSKSVPERLSWFLRRFTKEQDSRFLIELPLTHEEISYVVSCSRQKVTHYLNEWRKKQYITYDRGWIEVLQPELLFNN